MSERSIFRLILILALIGLLLVAWQAYQLWTGRARAAVAPRVEVAMTSIYFGNRLNDPSGLSCERVYAVERPAPNLANDGLVAKVTWALAALAAGPTSSEQAQGFTGSLTGARLALAALEAGVARVQVTWSGAIPAEDSCLSRAIRAEVEQTLQALPGIRQVDMVSALSTI